MSNEELCERIRAGEDDLAGELVSLNMGMIHQVARRYTLSVRRYGGADHEDLEQAAILGLLEAVKKWDAARGSFITAACFYMTRAIRLMLGISSTKRMIEHQAAIASLDTPVGEGSDTMLHELIADTSAVNPAEAACRADEIETVRAAVDELQEDMRTQIRRVYYDGELWPKEWQQRKRLEAGMQVLRRNKQLRSLYGDVIAAAYRRKGITSFNSSWSSVVEDAVIFEEMRCISAQVCRS